MEATGPLSGRRAQAARNDHLILDAAREVFVADPGAPISAVAERAGVGISALYRRYASKEDLLRRLSLEGLHRYIAAAEGALADDGDVWVAFARFLSQVVEADTHSLTLRLAGTGPRSSTISSSGGSGRPEPSGPTSKSTTSRSCSSSWRPFG
jgi:AcrR family transcriptional regulator